MRVRSRNILMLLGCAALAACSNPWEEYAPDFKHVLSGNWLYEEEPDKPVAAVYCYQTIGAADCHAAPLADEGGRLQGYQGPPPVTQNAQ
jgi:hypothetical protein